MPLSIRPSILIVLIGLLWLPDLPAQAETSVYELALKGKQCQEDSRQVLECEYRIGKTLHITITGIGQTDTAIAFLKSDENGDFYAAIGMRHGCVIVKPNPDLPNLANAFEFAFISPRSGKIYKTWQECEAGR
jgi:hypothetical protein